MDNNYKDLTPIRDNNMRVLVQSISTFKICLTYAPAQCSSMLISSSKSSVLLEFMNSWKLTFEIVLY